MFCVMLSDPGRDRDHGSSTGTVANRWSQYVPGGNTAGSPSRHRSRALAYFHTVVLRLKALLDRAQIKVRDEIEDEIRQVTLR